MVRRASMLGVRSRLVPATLGRRAGDDDRPAESLLLATSSGPDPVPDAADSDAHSQRACHELNCLVHEPRTSSAAGQRTRRLTVMTVTVTVPDELAARLQAAAAARGTSVEQLAIEMLSAVEIEPVVDSRFAGLVSDTITEHQAIVDRLAAT